MAQQMFNIEQDVLDEFRRLHKGDMSSLVTDMITNYLHIKQENLQLVQMRTKLEETQTQVEELKKEESNYKLLINELEREHQRQKDNVSKEDQQIRVWANNVWKDAKHNGTLTDLQFNAEQAGFTDIEEHLVTTWKKKDES